MIILKYDDLENLAQIVIKFNISYFTILLNK